MSFPVFAQARDSIDKAYVAFQKWNTNPANIPLPDVINTNRPKMTEAQISAAYLKSIEGNPNIDINKIPKMVARDRIDHELPITDWEPESQRKKRDFSCNQLSLKTLYRYCRTQPYYSFKTTTEHYAPVTVNLVGDTHPDCQCIEEFPIFFICNDENLKKIHDTWVEFSDQFLDYRNVSFLQTDAFGNEGPCQWNTTTCPSPETSQMAINQQINEAIETGLQTSIYLNKTMLDDYLTWRNYNSKPENFSYVVIADRPAVVSTPDNTGIIGAGIAAAVTGVGIISLTIRGALNYCKQGRRDDQSQRIG